MPVNQVRKTTWQIWWSMNRRCHDERCEGFPRYGGRGITVCAEWRDSFENFVRDMGMRPGNLTLDRSDNDGPYSKSNCQWVTTRVQSRNKSSSVLITIDGVTKCMMDWITHFGLKKNRVYGRWHRGERDPKRLFDERAYDKTMIDWNGKQKSLAQWARDCGLQPMTVYSRRADGITEPERLFAPIH